MAFALASDASHETVVRHSRFLAQARGVASVAEALAFLEVVRQVPATHHAWAYRIGDAYRFSDDGEPGGTAGKPILAAIDGQGVDRVIVVVTRWYGGINLGAGGLVRAYGGCAAECLRRAAKVPIVEEVERVVRFPFEASGALHRAFDSIGARKLEETFSAEGVEARVRLPAAAVAALERDIRDATRGRGSVVEVEAT